MSYNPMLNSITWIFGILIFCFLMKLIWKNRNLYYYSSKIPGPFPWPLIGNILIFSDGLEAFWDTMLKLAMNYPPIFKLWLTSHLMIINSVPEDVEVILSAFLEKSDLYDYGKDILGNGLLTAPVSVWKKHRKMINPSFNTRILTSFINIFSKHSKKLVKNLKTYSEQDDLLPVIWNTTLSTACETIADIDSSQITGLDEYISGVIRVEHLLAFRLSSFIYASDSIWKRLKFHREMQTLCSQLFDFVNKVIETRKLDELNTGDEIRNKVFLNQLLNLKENNNSISDKEILEETHTLLVTTSETTALTLSYALLLLSIHSDIQKKAHDELYSIFGNSERDATLEDVNRMEYLERVIKEVLRLFPAAPLIVRRADKTVKINSVVYPEGSNIVIPIGWLHRDPKYWRDPLNFDPDRFLPEESERRHRCSFIPLSFGPRNCIGFKYGMLALKVILSNILRYYELSSTKYKSISDIKIYFHLAAKPRDGCRVVLTRRRLNRCD